MIFFTPPDVGGNAMPRSTTYGQSSHIHHERQTQRQHLKKMVQSKLISEYILHPHTLGTAAFGVRKELQSRQKASGHMV